MEAVSGLFFEVIVSFLFFSLSFHRSNGEIKHIRVNSVENKYSLGKSKDLFSSIWDLVEAQLDKNLKSTKGDDQVQLMYVPKEEN